MTMTKRIQWISLLLLGHTFGHVNSGHPEEPLSEADRMAEYRKRGYTWPPTKYVPDTAGWRRLYERRFSQVEHVSDVYERYQAWFVAVKAAYVEPNFTEHGWGLTRAPESLVQALRQGIHDNIRNGLEKLPLENDPDIVNGAKPYFIPIPHLTNRVLREVHPMLEAWAGIDLQPITAYGFRLYRNQSTLSMHYDEAGTHIISCILHIDSSADSEPWSLLLEDYEGNTNEVILKPGDMLLYESSKCLHGRPRPFKGSWYSSVFVHFMPAEESWAIMFWKDIMGYPLTMTREATTEPAYPKLKMLGAALSEPGCEHDWCGLNETVKWSGPGEEGYVLTSGHYRYPLFATPDKEL